MVPHCLWTQGERPRTPPSCTCCCPHPQHTAERSLVRCAGAGSVLLVSLGTVPHAACRDGSGQEEQQTCLHWGPDAAVMFQMLPVIPACPIAELVGISLRMFFTSTLMSTNFLAYKKPGRGQQAHELRKGCLPDLLESCKPPTAPALEETGGRGFLLTLISVPLQDSSAASRAAGDMGLHQCHQKETAL